MLGDKATYHIDSSVTHNSYEFDNLYGAIWKETYNRYKDVTKEYFSKVMNSLSLKDYTMVLLEDRYESEENYLTTF